MIILIVGLILFIGIHSVRIVSDRARTDFIQKHSESLWKGVYSLVSLVGLGAIVYGYGQTRLDPVFLWYPPASLRVVASLLMLVAFILLVAAYIPRNIIKVKLGHPMYLAIKVWAIAHLISNGRLSEVILFGVFLLWAIVGFAVSRRRDRLTQANSDVVVNTSNSATVVTVVAGVVAYVVFAIWLHTWLIGVNPLA